LFLLTVARMAGMAYAIKDWDDTFEINRSREVKVKRWVAWPVRKDSEAFKKLTTSEGGMEAFGVFAYLVQLAARCPEPGVLVDDKGDITPERVAFRCGLTVDRVVKAFQLLSSQGVAWLIDTSPHPVVTSSQAIVTSSHQSATLSVLSSMYSDVCPVVETKGNPELSDEHKPPPTDVPTETPFEKFWKAWPKHFRKTKRPDAMKAWKKHGCDDRLPVILKKVAAFKKSRQWAEEEGKFIPFPSSWLNDQPWADDDPPRNEALWGPAKTLEQIRADKQMLADTFGWPKEAREREGLQ